MFFASKFFLGKGPTILNLDYLIEHTFHHRAKFRGNRPTELGNFAKGEMPAKHKPAPKAIASGRTKKNVRLYLREVN